jgi:ribosomal-protein-serine acetyltransferase
MHIELLPARPDLAAEMFAVVDGSRDFINEWLPWAENTRTVADEENFLNHMVDQAVARKAFGFIISADDRIVGSIDLHNVNLADKHAEIGYFLGEGATGHGIMHQAVAQIERFGFGDLALNKITIMAAARNTPSRLVAERAGYHFDGYLRDELLLHGAFVDCAVYSKLASEA